MIDHIMGRPNPSWKRAQVFLVILFWIWRLSIGNPEGPRVLWIRKLSKRLRRFSPWQIIVSTLTAVYAVKNIDKIAGLGAPEPLARLYSPSYYRATWIVTGLDAGFATAMSIRPKWFRDICSILFSIYYIIYANEADEKLRRFRAVPTVEMFRTTWEKTTNPYLRLLSSAPNGVFHRRILLPRPLSSMYDRPITVHIYFAAPLVQLYSCTDLVLDFPGGGFVAMTPEHHEERLRTWALRTRKPVVAVDYGKAPEYPYPFAMDECFDLYRLLAESNGRCIGMSGKQLNVVLSGDSAGATLVVGVMVKILQYNQSLSSSPLAKLCLPLALVLNYAALDFNFTSWMSPGNLRVLRSEQSSGNLPGLRELASQKDHLQHVSPLSMVGDRRRSGSVGKRRSLLRAKSWKDKLKDLAGNPTISVTGAGPDERMEGVQPTRTSTLAEKDRHTAALAMKRKSSVRSFEVQRPGAHDGADEYEENGYDALREEDRPLEDRVRYVYKENGMPDEEITPLPYAEQQHLHTCLESQQDELSKAVHRANIKAVSLVTGGRGGDKGASKEKGREPIGTRLTMTSRTGYFQDRVISPSMMRAMAILYIGPHRNPDFSTDYFLSPILTPSSLLAQFPPLLMQCGEKDPFVDDTVIFAGRVREAKRARKAELDMKLSSIGGSRPKAGEELQMSHVLSDTGAEIERLRRERDWLARETEDDWVQMVLFKDWSHGYLQMMSLMEEARPAVEDLADWIEDAFERYVGKEEGFHGEGRTNVVTRLPVPPVLATPAPAIASTTLEMRPGKKNSQRTDSADLRVLSHPHLPKERSEMVKSSVSSLSTVVTKASASSPEHDRTGTSADALVCPSLFTSEGETDDSGITFVPRKRLSMTSNSSSGSGGGNTRLTGTPPLPRRGSDERRPRTPMSEPGERERGREGGTPRSGSGGQRITEGELIRRRRLLDAHIFEGPGGV
ncbi:hypothetical protein ID866_1410 [Astraeus odoratus]|nr:hypothetical protein ID866_1410 [Astraeus odoratus]